MAIPAGQDEIAPGYVRWTPIPRKGGDMKLLVADNDADLVEMLTGWLRVRGYQVKYAFNAERIKSEWIEQQPDLVIVETQLKGFDTLGLCRDLQTVHDALVLAIAREQDIDTQIRCLESGADGYLAKPFLPGQLLAHIHALSRRVRRTLLRNPASILSVGPLKVDSLRHEVSVNGVVSRLTPTESKILHLLAVNANDVCTLDQIVAHVWGYGERSDTTLVKAHIRHLREKIERDPSNPSHIVTVAGSGYMLVRQPNQRAVQVPDTQPAWEAELEEVDETANLVGYFSLHEPELGEYRGAP
jgi:DNA-binding response OmpR family regulator